MFSLRLKTNPFFMKTMDYRDNIGSDGILTLPDSHFQFSEVLEKVTQKYKKLCFEDPFMNQNKKEFLSLYESEENKRLIISSFWYILYSLGDGMCNRNKEKESKKKKSGEKQKCTKERYNVLLKRHRNDIQSLYDRVSTYYVPFHLKSRGNLTRIKSRLKKSKAESTTVEYVLKKFPENLCKIIYIIFDFLFSPDTQNVSLFNDYDVGSGRRNRTSRSRIREGVDKGKFIQLRMGSQFLIKLYRLFKSWILFSQSIQSHDRSTLQSLFFWKKEYYNEKRRRSQLGGTLSTVSSGGTPTSPTCPISRPQVSVLTPNTNLRQNLFMLRSKGRFHLLKKRAKRKTIDNFFKKPFQPDHYIEKYREKCRRKARAYVDSLQTNVYTIDFLEEIQNFEILVNERKRLQKAKRRKKKRRIVRRKKRRKRPLKIHPLMKNPKKVGEEDHDEKEMKRKKEDKMIRKKIGRFRRFCDMKSRRMRYSQSTKHIFGVDLKKRSSLSPLMDHYINTVKQK